jgi:hypothetical protein
MMRSKKYFHIMPSALKLKGVEKASPIGKWLAFNNANHRIRYNQQRFRISNNLFLHNRGVFAR